MCKLWFKRSRLPKITMPGIPERWLEYTAVGKVIAGTKFICFKVPLKKALTNKLESKDRFSPDMLLEKYPGLGLVIDLTNTKRYYNSLEFKTRGVCYKKIFCPGRVVPSPDLLSQFIKNVDDFLNKTQDKLIGVHCTHGVNRTGYFVCSYMIRRLGISPEDAISEFETARGHRIERTLYVEELQKGSEKPLPPPPNEDEEVIGNSLDEPHPRKRERHRKRKQGDNQPYFADGQSSSYKDFQQGHFNHDSNLQMWQQCSDGGYGGHPQFREPYWHHGQGRPSYQPASTMPTSSGLRRAHLEHVSPLSGAYDDDNRSSFSRYGNQNGPKNYQGHRISLDASYGPNRGINNARERYNNYHWHRRGRPQNRNS